MCSIEAAKHISNVWHIIYGQDNKESRVNSIAQEVKSNLGIDYPNFEEPSRILGRFLHVARQWRKKFCKS